MISAYNGGAGGVLNTFSRDRKEAIKKINALNPKQVYSALTQKHSNAEKAHNPERSNQSSADVGAQMRNLLPSKTRPQLQHFPILK